MHVELSNATDLGFAPIYDFLSMLAGWLTLGNEEWLKAQSAIEHTLLAALWDARLDKELTDIEVHFSGRANVQFFEQHAAAA